MRALLPLVLLAACDTGGTDGGDTDTTESDAPATFARVRDEVLAPSCAFSVCHGSGTGDVQIDGTDDDYARLVGVASVGKPAVLLVAPGDSAASYLVHKLEGASDIVGARMPSGGELEADRLQLVKDWIDAGALQD